MHKFSVKTIFLLNLIAAASFFYSCSYQSSVNQVTDLITPTEFDEIRIPDKYNTGTEKNTSFSKITDSGYIADNVFLQIRADTNNYSINSYKNDVNTFPALSTIENYDFSDMNFIIANSQRFTANKTIIFKNCKFKGFRNDSSAPSESRVYCIFNNCDFSGNVGSSYITLNDCKIGGFTGDAMNPLAEFYANRLYVYDILHEGNKNGSHIDGIQIFGDQRSRNNKVGEFWISKAETGNIYFKNVRFEIPSINFEGNTSYVNACVMFQLEFSDVDNVCFENLFVNGGGKWYPLYMDNGKNNNRSIYGQWSHKNLIMKNAWVSDNFGTIFYPDLIEDSVRLNIEHYSRAYISSCWKDSDGTVHIITTNDTRSDAAITVKTNVGTFTFEIPHCPSNWALNGEIDKKTNPDESLKDKNGRAYSTYRWEDMPFDKEFIIPANPDFVVCYQGEEKLSYTSFDGRPHFYSEISQ